MDVDPSLITRLDYFNEDPASWLVEIVPDMIHRECGVWVSIVHDAYNELSGGYFVYIDETDIVREGAGANRKYKLSDAQEQAF